MRDQEVIRQNDLSDADLVADCRRRSSQARRDLADLQAEGVTAADLDSFDQEATAFEKMPSDDALEYARVALRQTRDAALEAGRSAPRTVLSPVRRAYGDTSSQLKRFGAGRLADANVAQVLNLLQDAQTTGTAYITDPKTTAEGFTQARLDGLAPPTPPCAPPSSSTSMPTRPASRAPAPACWPKTLSTPAAPAATTTTPKATLPGPACAAPRREQPRRSPKNLT